MCWWIELPFTGIATRWNNGLKEAMKFNELKYKILHLGQEHSSQHCSHVVRD